MALCLCLSAACLTAQTVFNDYTDGKVYVKFKPGATKGFDKEDPTNISLSKIAAVSKLISKYGITKAYKPFYQANDDARLPYILKFDFSNIKLVENFIEELRTIDGVEYAEKVPLTKTCIAPNDPSFGSQPFLNQINAQNAWNVFNGNSNITVAIVDNAVMWTHADLVANTYTNVAEANGTAGVDDDSNGYIDDINGYDVADDDNNAVPTNTNMSHGTHCAGIAGARTNNGVGIASIGWNLKIIPVKCSFNTSGTTTVDNGYGGIIYAAKAKARVISCSWGGTGSSAAEQTVIDYAWNKGSIIVAAAGNSNINSPHYPGAYNNVYCVASVSGTNVKSSFSNYGTSTNAWVDIAAPGENILSTVPNSGTGAYQQQSGTSMATPLVAGLCGLMLSKCSYMTQTDVINCINNTAANIYTIAANNAYSTNQQLGKGRIEAFAAMNCAAGFLSAPPIANFFALTRVTCPNTPVVFQDSSLYAPTNYTWSFQSGTPATSTLSSPSVQWSSPGTYSVSLTVSNANGSNSITKTSYINVSSPIALPLSEGFQSTPFLPLNWTSLNVNNDNVYWNRQTGVGGFTTGATQAAARFDNYNFDASGENDEMRTPKYIFTNVASARLRFDVAYRPYDTQYSDTLQVKLSTNCGTSWTNIYTKGGATLASVAGTVQANIFTPTATQWRRDSIDISALSAGQGNVMMSFVNRGHYGQALYVDNINLAFPTPTANFNNPATACVGSSITMTNTAIGAASYTWSFPGGSPATSNALNPGVVYNSPGIYTITLNSQNGTSFASTTKTVNVSYGNAVSVTSPSICIGTATTMVASGASTYTWNTGSNTASIPVSPTVTTTYTVKGTNAGCVSQKIATVTIKPLPNVAVSNQTICSGGTATLSASGATTYSWNTGFTGNPLIVSPGTNTTYTVTGTTNGCTNTKSVSVTIGSALSIQITPSQSTLCAAASTTLAASGATSFTWTPGGTGSSIIVAPNSTTSYSVTGSNGSCNGNNIITLTVVPTPSILVSASPSAICAGNSSTLSATGNYTSYVWSAPGGTTNAISVSPSNSSTYTVTASGNGGCSTSSVVSVTVNQNPVATAAATLASCSTCTDGAVSVTATGTGPFNYLWTPSGATTTVINGLAQGCYTVSVTDANMCSTQTQTCVGVNVSTGITALTISNELLIYPNPASEVAFIDYVGADFSYVLYNNLGQLVKQGAGSNRAVIVTSDLSKGVYTIVVEHAEKSIHKKLVIQ